MNEIVEFLHYGVVFGLPQISLARFPLRQATEGYVSVHHDVTECILAKLQGMLDDLAMTANNINQESGQ